MVDRNIPIIVGVGQVMQRWSDGDAANAPSPQSLMADAVAAALADTGQGDAVGSAADMVMVTRIFADSLPGDQHPFGKCTSLPRTVARLSGLSPQRAVYSHVGGNVPQALVNEQAAVLHEGTVKLAVLTGSEAIAAMKTALRGGITLDWSDDTHGETEDRGMGDMLLDMYELGNGLGAPPLTYPLFEHGLRSRLGRTRDEHLQDMSRLWAGFAKVARDNPYAQFDQDYDAAFLATQSAANYPVSDPYLKWHVAQDAVNQGAAVIMTTIGEAERLGIAPEKWIYLHGSAEAKDYLVSKRPDLSRSKAIEASLSMALERANKDTASIGHYDLYSCFPCAVTLAVEALGLDDETAELTVTGGLPFFGGAGNNYSMHAIVSMVEKLRAAPEDFGLVLANGGFLSKEAVGIYSAQPSDYIPQLVDNQTQAEVDAQPEMQRLEQDCTGVIESYTIGYSKGSMARAAICARVETDDHIARIVAATPRGDAALALLQQLGPDAPDPIGRKVAIVNDGMRNIIDAVFD
ncbi:hypothetical protein ACR9YC_01670 [Parasphingorhabdus sp. DH2-15]|uniref:hypothetical protein n=1 Tax=Parasphingorhabdus sp. DH2-15 TaxID=3444112 RepID=UPI003F687DBA